MLHNFQNWAFSIFFCFIFHFCLPVALHFSLIYRPNPYTSSKIMCDQHTTIHSHEHSDHEEHNHTEHNHSENNDWQEYFPAIVSGLLLLIGILLDNYHAKFFNQEIRLIGYLIAYFPVGFPVLKSAFNSIKRGDIFNEFFLMGLATIGAFGIGEYPEGVAVMLFYTIGELFQGAPCTLR
eukprot:Opistho-1_new@81421